MNHPIHTLPDVPPEDTVTIRCPRLGHQINFFYCRYENDGRPCFKALDCWYPYFKVHAYFEDKLSPEDFNSVFLSPKKPKIRSLIDLIEQAKIRNKKAY